jgi:hypothetical protein
LQTAASNNHPCVWFAMQEHLDEVAEGRTREEYREEVGSWNTRTEVWPYAVRIGNNLWLSAPRDFSSATDLSPLHCVIVSFGNKCNSEADDENLLRW